MIKRSLHIDVESRSTVDLLKTGAHAYWEHPDTDVICACFQVDDEETVHDWRMGDPVPEIIKQAVEEGWLIYAHNAGFERLCWWHKLGPKYGWPIPKLEQFRCTAAMAAAMALPRALGNAAAALGLKVQKDAQGRRLMLQMCKPRRMEGKTPVWWEDEERIERLIAYCRVDVLVEHALTKKLRPLTPREQELWFLDQRMNDRGVMIDIPNIKNAKHLVAEATTLANKELARLTNHRVTAATQSSLLAEWLDEHGVDLWIEDKKAKEKLEAAQAEALINDPDLKLEEIETQYRRSVDKRRVREALEVTEDPVVRRVLEIRQSTAKSSTAKLNSFLERVSADGRVRENLLFCAAGTGRWGGKGVQLQNLPRPALKMKHILGAIATLSARDLDWLKLFGDPISVISSCLRSFVVAGEGNEIIRADYSNIEGRVLAWLAGELSKLQAFRDFDAGLGPDIYLVGAAGIYGVDIATLNEDSPERQIGKVAELACGFQGGVGAFQTMATTYGVKVEDDEADKIKKAWRLRHPAIVQFWADLEQAAFNAVANPDCVFKAGPHIAFMFRKGVLWMQLPSGRRLAYIGACIKPKKMPWKDQDGNDVYKECVWFMGVNPLTKAWEPQSTYGGFFAENATQAVARDVMAYAMLRMDKRGWFLVLTVHDEIIAEVPTGSISVREFEEEMVREEPWLAGLPLAAKGAVGPRYGK